MRGLTNHRSATCFGVQATDLHAFQNAVPDFLLEHYPAASRHAAMIYVDTRRHFWRPGQTFVRFFGTSIVFALAWVVPMTAACTLVNARSAPNAYVPARKLPSPTAPWAANEERRTGRSGCDRDDGCLVGPVNRGHGGG